MRWHYAFLLPARPARQGRMWNHRASCWQSRHENQCAAYRANRSRQFVEQPISRAARDMVSGAAHASVIVLDTWRVACQVRRLVARGRNKRVTMRPRPCFARRSAPGGTGEIPAFGSSHRANRFTNRRGSVPQDIFPTTACFLAYSISETQAVCVFFMKGYDKSRWLTFRGYPLEGNEVLILGRRGARQLRERWARSPFAALPGLGILVPTELTARDSTDPFPRRGNAHFI